MGELTYTAIASLDGYIADEHGKFDWCEPDEEVHAFVNELERPIGTYLLGRRMYEVMSVWDNPELVVGQPAPMQDYAEIWRGADKVVYSTNLEEVSAPKTRLESEFDPETVRRMKDESQSDLSIGGAELAGHAFRSGLIDECRLYFAPVLVGGGTRALPDRVRLDLELVDERRFESGFVHLRHRVRS